jgi:hypothetical protein
MLTQEAISQRIKQYYPKGVQLTYIDYNDNLNDNKELMEELATTGYMDNFFENFDNYEAEFDAIDYISKEVFTAEELDEINANEDLKMAIDKTCHDIDTSNPLKDLLYNTSRRFFYYDLNFNLENFDGRQNVAKEAKKIAKKLKLDYTANEKDLRELVANASYGGQLCILFTANPSDLYGDKGKYITFKDNYDICIMNRSNGSGHSVSMHNTELIFKFIRENLHDDEGNAGYSFSGDVCGLVKFDEANFNFTNHKPDNVVPVKQNQQAKEFAEREAKYEATFKAGGCTFGDMKFARHRNAPYINEYPCGNKCTACGTFFID